MSNQMMVDSYLDDLFGYMKVQNMTDEIVEKKLQVPIEERELDFQEKISDLIKKSQIFSCKIYWLKSELNNLITA